MSPEEQKQKDRRSASSPPLMQHRHFAYIAKIINTFPPDMRSFAWRRFAEMLGPTNPNFDWKRFATACGAHEIEMDKRVEEYEEILRVQQGA